VDSYPFAKTKDTAVFGRKDLSGACILHLLLRRWNPIESKPKMDFDEKAWAGELASFE